MHFRRAMALGALCVALTGLLSPPASATTEATSLSISRLFQEQNQWCWAASGVNSLDPAFVAGTPGAAPATFAYYAVRTAASTGRQATVWVERAADGWTATNFTTGTEELTCPAQAGGDLVFTEPQVNAWYRVRDGRVPALNDPARQRVGEGVPVAAYQRLVHGLYGDKLPGSAYRAQGKLGGYDLAAAPGNGTWPLVAGGALRSAWPAGPPARRRTPAVDAGKVRPRVAP